MTTTGLRLGIRVMSESEESSGRYWAQKQLTSRQKASLCVLTQAPRPRPSVSSLRVKLKMKLWISYKPWKSNQREGKGEDPTFLQKPNKGGENPFFSQNSGQSLEVKLSFVYIGSPQPNSALRRPWFTWGTAHRAHKGSQSHDITTIAKHLSVKSILATLAAGEGQKCSLREVLIYGSFLSHHMEKPRHNSPSFPGSSQAVSLRGNPQ